MTFTNPAPQPPKSKLPPPSTYEILPPLHALFSRLLLPLSQTTAASPVANSPALSNIPHSTPLSAKDLATAVSAVKMRIQKARVTTRALPDVERTIEEQEVEISELEAEVERLERVSRDLRVAAKRAAEQHGG